MARDGGGGGGAFGWTILGVIVGVAGTLAVETLLSNHRASETVEAPVSSASVAIETPPAPAPTPVVAPPPANVVAVAPRTAANTPSEEDVEDDAAAAGMTSRSHPNSAQPATN